jgi:hypothetical protein
MISPFTIKLNRKSLRKVEFFVLDLTWKVFCMTGSVDTYLLMKEMEKDDAQTGEAPPEEESAAFDSTTERSDNNLGTY